MDQMPVRPNSAIILQQVYEGSEYTDLLALTFARNIDYCKRHAFDFELYYGNVIQEWKLGMGAWSKLALIYRALMQGYQYVVWLDADSMIVDIDGDLRAGCPKPEGVGMVRHPASLDSFCTGNIYVTNARATCDLLLYWMQWYPGPDGWHEQAAANLLSQLPCFKDLFVAIDHKYNSCRAGGSRVDNPAVEGFHGEGNPARRLELMKEYLKKLEAS